MKILNILLFFLCATGINAQQLDSIGINNNCHLNKYEVELLNSLLQEQRDTFDFKDKKVAFVTGSVGGAIVTKSEYFKNSVIPWIENDSSPQIFMVRLTDEEKSKSGGYDVLVASWVKFFTNRQKGKIIKRLEKVKSQTSMFKINNRI